jgi:tetratricopeptide (TPR) repeat protein
VCFVCAEPTGAALAGDHLLSLLLVAPEIAQQISVPAEIRDSFRFSREGNPQAWTRRTAHGVADFLRAFLEQTRGHLSVAFTNLKSADPSDCELIDILRQRSDPDRLRIDCNDASESGDIVAGALGFLRAGSALWRDRDFEDAAGPAITLLRASDLAMRMALYDAALEWASLGRTHLDATQAEDWGKFTRNMLFALLLLGRIPEAEALCAEVQARPPEPAILAHVTYAMAILNARLYDPARHDYDAAKAWIEQSLEYTQRLPASETLSVNHAFLMNTMALVEMRKGRQDAALELLNAGLALMESEARHRYAFECGILLHNRAKLHRAMKQADHAIEDLTLLLRFEPSSSEAYFDRGLLRHRAGCHQAALADYDAALRWSPPYWEPYFNRAQVRLALGDRDAALRDYERVLVLHPAHVESRAHAFCLRGLIAMEAQDLAAAAQNFSAAIAADPDLADAWANRATILFRQGDAAAALRDLDHALALREDAETLCNRGRVLESLERRREAVADYRRALALGVSGAEKVQRRLECCIALEQDAHGQPATPAV